MTGSTTEPLSISNFREISNQMTWMDELMTRCKNWVLKLNEAEITEKGFDAIKDEVEFELQLEIERGKSSIRTVRNSLITCEKESENLNQILKATSAEVEQLQNDLSEMRHKEAMGPLLAAQAAQNLLLSMGDPIPPTSLRKTKSLSCSCHEDAISVSEEDGSCPHKSAMASKIIDGVFDHHTVLLRKRLRAKDDEIKKLKNTQTFKRISELEHLIKALEDKTTEAEQKQMSSLESSMRLKSEITIQNLNFEKLKEEKDSFEKRYLEGIEKTMRCKVQAADDVIAIQSNYEQQLEKIDKNIQIWCSNMLSQLPTTSTTTIIQIAERFTTPECCWDDNLREVGYKVCRVFNLILRYHQQTITSLSDINKSIAVPPPPITSNPSPIPYGSGSSSITKAYLNSNINNKASLEQHDHPKRWVVKLDRESRRSVN